MSGVVTDSRVIVVSVDGQDHYCWFILLRTRGLKHLGRVLKRNGRTGDPSNQNVWYDISFLFPFWFNLHNVL